MKNVAAARAQTEANTRTPNTVVVPQVAPQLRKSRTTLSADKSDNSNMKIAPEVAPQGNLNTSCRLSKPSWRSLTLPDLLTLPMFKVVAESSGALATTLAAEGLPPGDILRPLNLTPVERQIIAVAAATR